MIERYSRPEMANIWTEENKYRAWLEVEILADEAWAELGEIPKEDVALIREKADFDIDRILEIEQHTRHDVVAFTRAVSETLGEERKWVHYGLTSTDVVDTAYGLSLIHISLVFLSLKAQLEMSRCDLLCGIPDQIILPIFFRPDGEDNFINVFEQL